MQVTPESVVLKTLREATWPIHQKLDRHPLLAPLTSPKLDKRLYTNALAALAGPFTAFEHSVHGKANQFEWVTEYQIRSGSLSSDLRQLGSAPFAFTLDNCLLEDEASLLGLLYLLEGSRFGASVIARNLNQALPDDLPKEFFSNPSPPEWPTYWLKQANQLPRSAHDKLLSSATKSFTIFVSHLDLSLKFTT
ncbi:biliverdin-producing heme oxygenase [Magnetofaba australis]|uniref:biliverdin-producing heme oxygenase n=1 Tax=Magnetofaba australis TaxID=1472297 RepID=UPI00117C03A6|nr:biliverdin-producing heme oxygenase [Magnetofaba australis]